MQDTERTGRTETKEELERQFGELVARYAQCATKINHPFAQHINAVAYKKLQEFAERNPGFKQRVDNLPRVKAKKKA
jgi:hypothetical protein